MRALWSKVAFGIGLTACSNAGSVLPDNGLAWTHDAGDARQTGPDQDAARWPPAEAGNGSGERDAGEADAGDRQDASEDGDASGPALDAGDPPGAGCAGKSYKLCEDFEGTTVGSLPGGWTEVTAWGGGAAVVTDGEAHSGTQSLKSANVANGHTRAGTSLAGLGATADKHWGRIFFKVRAPATLPPAVDPPGFPVIHNTLVGLIGSTESRVVDTVVNTEGKTQFLYNLPDDSCCQGSDYLYTPYDGAWHCAEWYVDAGAGQFRFYYDGGEVALGFEAGKAKLGSFSQIVVGWINYQTSEKPYNQAWFDDLALDDSRIGCN